MPSDITISKGSFTATIQQTRVVDHFSNQLFTISVPQATTNQTNGVNSIKIVDLLRVTHTIEIFGEISPTASVSALAVKQAIVNIWKGGGEAGGTCTLTYDYNAQSIGDTTQTATTTLTGYIEDVTFTEANQDPPTDFDSSFTKYQDIARWEVDLKFLEGTQA